MHLLQFEGAGLGIIPFFSRLLEMKERDRIPWPSSSSPGTSGLVIPLSLRLFPRWNCLESCSVNDSSFATDWFCWGPPNFVTFCARSLNRWRGKSGVANEYECWFLRIGASYLHRYRFDWIDLYGFTSSLQLIATNLSKYSNNPES